MDDFENDINPEAKCIMHSDAAILCAYCLSRLNPHANYDNNREFVVNFERGSRFGTCGIKTHLETLWQ